MNSNNSDRNEVEKNLIEYEVKKELKVTTEFALSPKVVSAIKKFPASYNEDANKIVEQAEQVKAVSKKLNFYFLSYDCHSGWG